MTETQIRTALKGNKELLERFELYCTITKRFKREVAYNGENPKEWIKAMIAADKAKAEKKQAKKEEAEKVAALLKECKKMKIDVVAILEKELSDKKNAKVYEQIAELEEQLATKSAQIEKLKESLK